MKPRTLLTALKQRLCSHRFDFNALELVNRDSHGDDRVRWACDRCGRVFTAHCGLDIVPRHGPIMPRSGPLLPKGLL